MLDHFDCVISCDQTRKWGIEWDLCAPTNSNRNIVREYGVRQLPEMTGVCVGGPIGSLSGAGQIAYADSPGRGGQIICPEAGSLALTETRINLPYVACRLRVACRA